MIESGRRTAPSLKLYLVRTASALTLLRKQSDEQDDYELSTFEKLVVALEDRRYFRHKGFDWRSVVREIIKAATLRRHGGASTIEMQFVRTVTGRYERTLRRKLQEIVLSVLLGYHLDKVTILRSYLNRAYFGTGLWGVRSAAQSMFSKQPLELSLEESASLAAMLVYPRPRQPSAQWDARVRRRAIYGIRLLGRLDQSLK